MSAKKKRMGSHRRSNQNKVDTESVHVEGSASAAELVQEEKSVADLGASPDYSQSATQQSPSSEMTGHRRKLGSSRSKKGRGLVKDSLTESGHKPRVEIEDTKDNETLEINMSIETPKDRDLNYPSEHYGDSSLLSLHVPDVMDALISRSENQQEAHNEKEADSGLVSDFHKLEEPKLESIDVSLTQSGDVTSESAHYVDTSIFHTSPAISNSTYMEVSDVASSVYSLTEKQNRERDDTDLVRQDNPSPANPFVETETAESSIISGLSTKENLREHAEIKCSIEEIPKEEIHLDEEQSELINFSQEEGAHQSEDDLTEREAESAQMQDVQHILVSSDSVTNEAEDTSDTGSVKLTDQLALHWVYRDEDQVEDDIRPTAEQAVRHEMKDLLSDDSRKESSSDTFYTEMNAPLASQHQDTLDRQPDADFHPTMSRRKLGSSRRKKGRHHVKDSAAESQNQNKEEVPGKIDNETGGTTEITSSAEVVMEEKSVKTVLEGMDTSENVTDGVKDDAHLVDIPELIHLNVQSGPTVDQQLIDQTKSTEITQEELHSVDSATDPQYKEKDEETEVSTHDGDGDAGILESESHVKSEDTEFLQIHEATAEKPSLREHIEVEYSVDQEILSLPQEVHLNQDKNEHFNISESGEALQSTDVFNEKDTEATKIQDTHPVLVTSETVTHEAMDRSDINFIKSTDQAEISDTYQLTIKGSDDSSTQQDVSSPDNKDEQSVKPSNLETLDHKKEDYYTREPQISDLGSRDTEVGQVYEVEDQLEVDLKPTVEEVVHDEKMKDVPSEDVDRDSSIPSMHTDIDAPFASTQQDTLEQQPDTDFHPIMSRRKLGSSRRNKGRHHVKDSATDPPYKEKDEETEVSTHEGDGDAGLLESESHVKSEHVEFLQFHEATAEKPSLGEHIETILTEVDTSAKDSDEVKDTIDLVSIINVESSPAADQQLVEIEYSADEEKTSLPLAEDAYLNEKLTNLSEIGEAHQSNTEATKIQDMLQVVVTSERLTHEATDSFSTYSLNLSDTELGQVQKDEDRAEDDLKPATEEAVLHELKEVPSEVEETQRSLQTVHTEVNVSLPSEHQDIFDNEEKQTRMTSRRKLGSSRRIKHKQHVKDSAESLEEIKKDIRGNKDSPQTEVREIRDDSPLVGTSEINNSSVQSSPLVDPQLADQTNTREMPHEDLHSLDSAPERSTNREEETGTAKQDGNVQANNLVKEPHVKPEEKESSKVEITVENTSFGENTTQESNVNETCVSLQKELSTNEQQNRLLSLSGHTVPQNLEDKVSEVDGEIKTTLQNTQLEMHIRLDTQPLENPQDIQSEQTLASVETIEDGDTKKLAEGRENHNAEVEESVNVDVPGYVEVGLQHEAPAVKETQALVEFTHPELFPVPHNETKTVAQLDTFLEENVRAEASMEESSISEVGDECKDQGIPDQSENVQIKPQQKKRKMGSTRRTQMNRKQEEENETEGGNFHTDIDGRDREKTKVVEELPVVLMQKLNENETPLQIETRKESSALEEEHKTLGNETIDLMAAVPLQVPPHGEAVVHPVMFANAASVSNSEKNDDVILNTSQPVDLRNAEIHIPSVVAESSSISINQLLPVNTENEMSQSTQNDDKIPESLSKTECEDSIEQKALKSAELPALERVKEEAGEGYNNTLDDMRERNRLHEGASNINTETKNESPDLNLTNRRRKIGSTRRSLGTRPKREDLNEEQAESTENTEMTLSIYGVTEKSLQLQTEHEDGDSKQGTDKGFERVDYSNIGDTCKTSVPQQLDDENPVSQGSLEDSDQLISEDLTEIPAASSNLDAMSDSAVGGRRRKMGSHRRSRGPQTTKQGEITDTQNGSDGRIVKDESVMKTAEKKLDKITEVNESYTNPFSISTSSTSQTVSEKPSERMSPVQHLYPDVQLGQEKQKKLSLGYTRGANLSDAMHDVVMIGDSCVGKTSFMKRAQSGKFSLDLPASVGLDSCIWTVIVDGKTVVLHLWDTAGQERFRSLTRQTFHKAQAFLLMYDVSSADSFSAISYWVNCIKEGAAEDVIVLLLGNKCDHTKRQIKTQQGENLAKEYNFDFMECSAATGENVIESLETVARLLSQRAVTTEETLVLLKESKPKNKSGCC